MRSAKSIDIRHFRAFLSVVEAAHQGRAAGALGIQQSTLSRQIAALEDDLGVSLFERDHAGMHLSVAGDAFLIAARRAVFEFDRAVTLAARSGRAEAGHVAIGFLISLSAGRQRELIATFAGRAKDVLIDFVEAGREELLQRLRDRQLDVGFVPALNDAPGLETERLWTEHFYVAVREDHPFAQRADISWADLADEPLLLRAYESASQMQAFLVSKLTHDADRLKIRQLNVSRESLINLVGMGQGVAIATDAAQGMGYPGVVFRPIDRADARLPVSMVWVRQNNNPVLRAFLSFAKHRAGSWIPKLTP